MEYAPLQPISCLRIDFAILRQEASIWIDAPGKENNRMVKNRELKPHSRITRTVWSLDLRLRTGLPVPPRPQPGKIPGAEISRTQALAWFRRALVKRELGEDMTRWGQAPFDAASKAARKLNLPQVERQTKASILPNSGRSLRLDRCISRPTWRDRPPTSANAAGTANRDG
jgi:hypothetical protein